jgi:hypothetical protein
MTSRIVAKLMTRHADESSLGELNVTGIDNQGRTLTHFEVEPLMSREIIIRRTDDDSYDVSFCERGTSHVSIRDVMMNTLRRDLIGWLTMCEFAFNSDDFYTHDGLHVSVCDGSDRPMHLSDME